MDSVKQLIIRACKSKNPEKRLRTLYRRFYLTQVDDKTDFFIAGILTSICDTYLNVTVTQMVSDFCPQTAWKHGIDDEDTYWAAAVKILTGYIRLAERDRFPGLTPPAQFRGAES